MGSVPNCREEIPNRYGIRWFKCKLKPPKNQHTVVVTHLGRSDIGGRSTRLSRRKVTFKSAAQVHSARGTFLPVPKLCCKYSGKHSFTDQPNHSPSAYVQPKCHNQHASRQIVPNLSHFPMSII